MVWTLETSCGYESAKIAPIAAQYLQGRFLDIGCGQSKIWPSAIGIDNGHHFGKGAADIQADATDLSMFADGCMDAVFSSHTLEHVPFDRVPTVLAEWARVIRLGGYLVLYLPSGNLYPRIGDEGANPDHRWDPMPGDIEAILRAQTANGVYGWELVESEERGELDEYSLFVVARKTATGWAEKVWQRNPNGQRRALVCRFGAIGDQIIATAVLPGLKRKGYHVTYMTTPKAAKVVQHDPHIDEWFVIENDYVPNQELGPFWDSVARRYDRFINLSESIEGTLLTLPGRLTHAYPDDVRRKVCGTVNYLQRTADIAGVDLKDCRARFYATKQEREWAQSVRRTYPGAPIIAWAVHGSSPHKVYPWTATVVVWLLRQTPAHVFLLAAEKVGAILEDGILGKLTETGADMSRVHGVSGNWDVRKALAFCQEADCVVGPETGPLNAVCAEAVPKVIYLSHSSHENLTRDWVNTTVLQPERAPCFPCHRLHYTWEHCHQDTESGAALCAAGVAPERVFEAIAVALGARRAA